MEIVIRHSAPSCRGLASPKASVGVWLLVLIVCLPFLGHIACFWCGVGGGRAGGVGLCGSEGAWVGLCWHMLEGISLPPSLPLSLSLSPPPLSLLFSPLFFSPLFLSSLSLSPLFLALSLSLSLSLSLFFFLSVSLSCSLSLSCLLLVELFTYTLSARDLWKRNALEEVHTFWKGCVLFHCKFIKRAFICIYLSVYSAIALFG